MLSVIKQSVRSVFADPTQGDEEKRPRQSTSESRELLQRCPNCETVYLSEETRQCSTCEEMTVSVTENEQVDDE
jgi:hypothetical protein